MDARIDSYFKEQRDRHLDELNQYLRIPSISALSQHRPDIRRAAEWVAAQLRSAGAENVELMDTPGNPMVYGQWLQAPGAPTVLIYGHYDVQPADPEREWVSPPFEPTLRDGRLYARGVSDDKAPSFQALKAVEAWLALDGRLPVNVKFLLEGEEELGSPNMRPFVREHAGLLKADVVISADGAMWRASEPSITVAARGLCGLQVNLTTARSDLHSGRHGGAVPNALHCLAELIATLHDREGRVAVDGFYDSVRPLTASERAHFAALPFDEEAYRDDLKLSALVGEPGFSTLERQWARPSLDVNGMWGGFTGEGSKTVIPKEAHAKLTCRLVADQEPEQVLQLVTTHLRTHTPAGAHIDFSDTEGGSVPYTVPADLPALQAAGEVLEEVLGQPALYVRMGGSIPAAEVFQAELGLYTLFYSFSTADEMFHAPNEFFRMERFDAGLRAWAGLLQRLGTTA